MIPTFRVTRFRDRAAASKREDAMTLDRLAGLVFHTRAPTKDALPWLKLATFGPLRTENRSLRHNANVQAIHGVEGDYDAELIQPDAAFALLRAAGLCCLVYTSPSHSPAAPRWRVICPTSQPLPPERRTPLLGRVNGVLGGVLAPESFVLAQAYFFGRVGDAPHHQALWRDGTYIDQRPDLDAAAIAPDHNPQAATYNARAEETPLSDITTWIRGIPNFDDLEWEDWNTIGLALFAATGGSDEGLELWHEWSAKSAKSTADITQKRWDHYRRSPPNRISGGKLFYWYSRFVEAAEYAYNPAGDPRYNWDGD